MNCSCCSPIGQTEAKAVRTTLVMNRSALLCLPTARSHPDDVPPVRSVRLPKRLIMPNACLTPPMSLRLPRSRGCRRGSVKPSALARCAGATRARYVPVTTASEGQPRSLTGGRASSPRSQLRQVRHDQRHRLPKLIVRVRFSSPAPRSPSSKYWLSADPRTPGTDARAFVPLDAQCSAITAPSAVQADSRFV
jgi:hypothetical protein